MPGNISSYGGGSSCTMASRCWMMTMSRPRASCVHDSRKPPWDRSATRMFMSDCARASDASRGGRLTGVGAGEATAQRTSPVERTLRRWRSDAASRALGESGAGEGSSGGRGRGLTGDVGERTGEEGSDRGDTAGGRGMRGSGQIARAMEARSSPGDAEGVGERTERRRS